VKVTRKFLKSKFVSPRICWATGSSAQFWYLPVARGHGTNVVRFE